MTAGTVKREGKSWVVIVWHRVPIRRALLRWVTIPQTRGLSNGGWFVPVDCLRRPLAVTLDENQHVLVRFRKLATGIELLCHAYTRSQHW